MKNGRCYLHGGKCTGPKNLTGYRERFMLIRTVGYPKGRPRTQKGWHRLIMDEIERLPPVPVDKPRSEWNAGELLAHVARLSLMRAAELIERPIKDDLDPKEHRRVEIGLAAGARIVAKIQADRMRIEAGEQRLVEYEAAAAAFEKQLARKSRP